MHVAQYQPADRMWTVGYYDPAGVWHAVEDVETGEEASERVAFLNGARPELMGDQLDAIAEAVAKRIGFGPGSNEFEMVAAKQEAHEAGALVQKLVELWKSAGVFGFVCKDQTRVPELLAAFASAERWLSE